MAAWYSDPDCVAAWLFDGESGGDDATDYAPIAQNPLTDLGGVACLRNASGKFGDCLETDGSSDMALGITDAAQTGLDLQFDNWSLVLWVKSDGAWPGDDPIFIGKWTSGNGYQIRYNTGVPNIVGVYTDGTASHVVTSLAAPAASTWIHIAMVKLNGVLQLYVDGVLQSTAENLRDCELTAADFVLGTNHDRDAYFNGFIDDVAVFKRGLTQNEIRAIMRDSLSGAGSVLQQATVFIRSLAARASIRRGLGDLAQTPALAEPGLASRNIGNATVQTVNIVKGEIRVTAL